MKRRTKCILLALAAALAGCATVYQKEGLFTNGYSDFRLGEDTFVISFRANEFTPPDQVMDFALKRAAELARKKGYRYFTIVDHREAGDHETSFKGKKKGSKKPIRLYYPSVQITVRCYHTPPLNADFIDVHSV